MLNRRPQILHEKGFSPVCILSCRDNQDGALNFLEQKRQLYLKIFSIPCTSCGRIVGISKMKLEKYYHSDFIFSNRCLFPTGMLTNYINQCASARRFFSRYKQSQKILGCLFRTTEKSPKI